jgi:hypothetical protein
LLYLTLARGRAQYFIALDRLVFFLDLERPTRQRLTSNCPNIFYYVRALVRCYQYTALRARSATGVEVCNRSAHCEGINGSQPYNPSCFLLLATPTRSAHGSAGATGSVRHKRVRCNSDIVQLEKHLTASQKFATSVDLSATTISSHGPAAR